MKEHFEQFCTDLSTHPIPGYKILVTGATGYIGGELIPELIARGYSVRVMVRGNVADYADRWPEADIVSADVLDFTALKKATEGIHCAYYLIHSLHLGKKKFKEVDCQAAINFQRASEENKLERIIYLGGLGNPEATLSDHLRSRLLVAEELQKGKTPVTFLRAAVIVGSGSTSYKIIKNLIRNCPVFLFPSKGNSKCQPIAVRDVIKYLVGSLENRDTSGKSFDIGGRDVLTYQQMLKIQAKLIRKKRYFLPSFFFTVNFYSHVTNFFTPVHFDVIKCLMESCVNDVVCQNNEIQSYLPFQPLTYQEAIEKAFIVDSQTRTLKILKAKKDRLDRKQTKIKPLEPPGKSNGILSDIKNFLLHKPSIPTLIKFNSPTERENYTFRILQRLEVKVSNYKIFNMHKIGVNAPAKYVFEELLKWNGDSTCWPNHIAKVERKDDRLEELTIYLFGWTKYPLWIKNLLQKMNFFPLFKLHSIRFKKIPDPMAADNARYLLYESFGGYPIGVFTMYVRSSIESQNEDEQAQLFLMVGFNFYGKEKWSTKRLVNRPWEMIHDRVTSNVLYRIKQLCEWRFEKLKEGTN
jgi:uncharacterized protein YbjT (DUF2867 family)